MYSPLLPYFTHLLCICVMISRRRSSTSSRVQVIRNEFWLISSPETATPPALDALPGAYRIPFFKNQLTASYVEGMLAPSATAIQPLCVSFFASSSFNSFCVAHGNATSHFTAQGVSWAM